MCNTNGIYILNFASVSKKFLPGFLTLPLFFLSGFLTFDHYFLNFSVPVSKYIHVCTCEHRNNQSLRQGKAKQLYTPEDNSFFPRGKEELPQVGFEPVTFGVLDRHSTN